MGAQPLLVDASVFLGMHATDDALRRACKRFFVEAMEQPLVMSLEDVGWCDNVIWSRPRALQDAYYPFMDNLHTEMSIERIGLTRSDLAEADDSRFDGLRDPERLLVALARRTGAVLVSVNERLLGRAGLLVRRPEPAPSEARFEEPIEQLYGPSLALRVLAHEMVRPS